MYMFLQSLSWVQGELMCCPALLWSAAVLSAAVRSPRLKLILDCGVLPVYVLSCLVPQATLLYWLGNSIFFTTMQAALNNTKVARAVGLPNMLLPTPRGAQEERGAFRVWG